MRRGASPSWIVVVAAIASATAAGCTAGIGFACSDDDACRGAGPGGACEAPGYCTFEDEACGSGRRYGAHAADGLAGTCVDDGPSGSSGAETSTTLASSMSSASAQGTGGTSTTGDPSTGGATMSPGTSNASTSSATGSTTMPIQDCSNGSQEGEETDIDCGGPCSPCGSCLGCAVDTDCEEGPCTDGVCSMRTEITVDFVTHCPEPDSFTFQLPAGTYRATALGGAGDFMAASKWNNDDTNMGSTWYWWIPCEPLDLDQLSTSSNYFPTDEDAFMNLAAHEQTVVLDGVPVSCGLVDSNCLDNRGGVTFALELVCN